MGFLGFFKKVGKKIGSFANNVVHKVGSIGKKVLNVARKVTGVGGNVLGILGTGAGLLGQPEFAIPLLAASGGLKSVNKGLGG